MQLKTVETSTQFLNVYKLKQRIMFSILINQHPLFLNKFVKSD